MRTETVERIRSLNDSNIRRKLNYGQIVKLLRSDNTSKSFKRQLIDRLVMATPVDKREQSRAKWNRVMQLAEIVEPVTELEHKKQIEELKSLKKVQET